MQTWISLLPKRSAPDLALDMRAAIYARVSTADQHTDNQVVELREWARALAHEVVAEYIDVQSGARDDRPGLQRLLGDAHRRKFDVVLFWSLDRLSRGGIAKTLSLLRQLADRGVKFRSLRQDCIDTAGPLGELLIAVFAALGDIERQQHSDRTRAGLHRARLRGAQLGRPRIHFDPLKLEELRQRGYNLNEIARSLGVSVSTLGRAQSKAARTKEAKSIRPATTSAPETPGDGNGSAAVTGPLRTTSPTPEASSTSAAYCTDASGTLPDATRAGPAL